MNRFELVAALVGAAASAAAFTAFAYVILKELNRRA